jgi:transposase InsO family protein
MYPHVGVGYLCRLFGKTRQGWYEQCDRKEDRSLSHIMVLKLVQEIRQSLPRVGARKLLHMLEPSLKEHNIKMGRDKLYDLLGHHGLLLRYRRRNPYTTDPNHPYRKYPNLIRDLILTGSEQLWVSDITYLRLTKGFCYLSIVTDAYSRKIVGYQVHPTLASEGAIRSLVMAIHTRKSKHPLVHHSDRGIQYCCSEYVDMLHHCRIQISMTENGDPYENAIAERVNGILKGEFGLDKTFATTDHAAEATSQAVTAYNYKRPHASCDYLTPAIAHEQKGILRKRWKTTPHKTLQKINT